MSRRYAENTTVTVERSIDEIRRYAELRGAEQLTYAVGPQGGMVRFMLDGRVRCRTCRREASRRHRERNREGRT